MQLLVDVISDSGHSGDSAEVLALVATLSVRRRRILTLRKIYGWEYERIAAHLGMNVQAVEEELCACVQTVARVFEPSVAETHVDAAAVLRAKQSSVRALPAVLARHSHR